MHVQKQRGKRELPLTEFKFLCPGLNNFALLAKLQCEPQIQSHFGLSCSQFSFSLAIQKFQTIANLSLKPIYPDSSYDQTHLKT